MRVRCPPFCSKVCCCLRLDKKRRILNKNYKNLEKEIHISYILKQLRVVKNLAKEALTQDQWRRAFAKYSLISYMTEEDNGHRIMEHRDLKNFAAEPELIEDESKDK